MANIKKNKKLKIEFGKIKIEAEDLHETSLIAILIFFIVLSGMTIFFSILR